MRGPGDYYGEDPDSEEHSETVRDRDDPFRKPEIDPYGTGIDPYEPDDAA